MTVFINGRERKNRDILDLFVFALLSGMLPFWCLGQIGIGEDMTIHGDSLMSMEAWLLIPLVVLFVLLAAFFLVRRTPYLEKTFKRNAVLALFLFFFVGRLFSIFLFPYGDTAFTFTSPVSDMTVTIHYDYLLKDRIFSLLQDSCFGFYFVLLFGYTDTFGKKGTILSDLVLALLVLTPLLCFAYSMVFEREVYINNIYALLQKDGYVFQNLQGFTTHKNTYGFLMTLGCMATYILFAKKPNPLFPVLDLFFLFNALLCHSRISIILCAVSILLFFLAYPFFAYKKHKVAAIGMAVLDGLLVLFLIVIGILAKEKVTEIFQGLWDSLTNFHSIDMRKDHRLNALAMMDDNWFKAFGYGRLPFNNLYYRFQVLIGAESHVITSHCGFLEVYMHFGLVGLVITAIFVLYCFYMTFRLFAGKNKLLAFTYLFIYVLLLVHCALEPRFFLTDEGSSLLLLMIITYPTMRTYHDDILMKKKAVCHPLGEN